MYHVPLALQFVYGRSYEGGKNGDGQEESEISGGRKRVDIAWYLAYRLVGFVLRSMMGRFVEVCRRRGIFEYVFLILDYECTYLRIKYYLALSIIFNCY